MFILEFPPEIILLILIRLPVKTLARLKCFSKYFSGLVSSPGFIRDHLKFSTEDASMSRYKLMFQKFFDPNLNQTSIQSLCQESPIYFFDVDYPEKQLYRSVRVVGSCNGLVVIILNQKHIIVWNPAIKKHEKLPSIVRVENRADNKKGKGFHCGFGFDALNDDYKVVSLFELKCPGSTSNMDVSYAVCVYSLKRRSWMRIPDFTCEKFDETFAKFAFGKLHWRSYRRNIISLDVGTEVFGTVEQPNYGQGLEILMLSVLGGSFCLSCHYNRRVDVWLLKEYGSKLSWTNIFTLSSQYLYGYAKSHSIMPNGEILIDTGSYICFYNPKYGSWRSTEIWVDYDPVIYVESLVSPCCN